jgi:hypothetical protein
MEEATRRVASVTLYGEALLDPVAPCRSELFVNGLPLALRPHRDPNDPTRELAHLKGERFVDHFCGWSLVLSRRMGERANLKHRCFGIQTQLRRELCDQTMPCPGPGGPTVEAPLYVDTFSILNWNWRFWGDDTRMVFASSHSSGPDDEAGHVGYEHGTPEACKRFLQNRHRRTYPGSMVIHGGLFHNAKTGHWIAITCRQPTVGYVLNIEDAGRGVGYDFTLHAPFGLGETLRLPEIKIYFGPDEASRLRWLADYAMAYYEEPPEWVHRTHWGPGLAWDNAPTWGEQAAAWERSLDDGLFSGISYCLVTNRPVKSGTTPLGYEPDPNHGTQAEFKAMCHRMADRGVPLLVWMSHSGLAYQGGDEVDDDWFIRGVDDRVTAAWGSIDGAELGCINPGHPGYIEYTKKWIRFYIGECRCKGIFFDCLSWVFPPDFRSRPWMRYPGDTNRMALRFMREAYRCIKDCDPDAILLGEGTTLEGPVNVFSVHTNPKRAVDGMGPRDFLLSLNPYGDKRFVIDQGPRWFPGSGMCKSDNRPAATAVNRYLTTLLRERGGRDAFTSLPGDLSVLDDLLFVPSAGGKGEPTNVSLPVAHDAVVCLADVLGVRRIAKTDGVFRDVPPGVYRMETEPQR